MIAVFANTTIANAFDFTAENSDGVTIYYNIVSEDELTCEVTYEYGKGFLSYNYQGDIKIPSSVEFYEKKYSVIGIGEYAFAGNISLISIEIPISVTSNGKTAFKECTALTSVVIPNSLTSIGSSAFSSCI